MFWYSTTFQKSDKRKKMSIVIFFIFISSIKFWNLFKNSLNFSKKGLISIKLVTFFYTNVEYQYWDKISLIWSFWQKCSQRPWKNSKTFDKDVCPGVYFPLIKNQQYITQLTVYLLKHFCRGFSWLWRAQLLNSIMTFSNTQ